MKKLIILLLVISATVLTAQNYQYFTAKQGIPKALEIAKAYFNNDSVNLYSIKCLRWEMVLDTSGLSGCTERMVIFDSINPYNNLTGTSLYWYYLACDSNDTCNYFRIWNKAGNYELDFVFEGFKKYDYPLHEEDIIFDTDYLVNCLHFFCNDYLKYSELFFSKDGRPFDTENLPIWKYYWRSKIDISGEDSYINTKTCECHWDVLDVSEENKNNSPLIIKSDPNSGNIIIELNSDLIQNAELRLYDQVGVLLFADKLNDKSYELSTYIYPSGLYILQIKYGGNLITKTVMIVH